MDNVLYKDYSEFIMVLEDAFKNAKIKLTASLKKAVINALGERDETAEIVRNKDGEPEPDTELRDYENVPLSQDIYQYFEKEVKPYVSDACINKKVRDHKDGKIGKIGYEINFNKYFYKYEPPRNLEEITADIMALKGEIEELLERVEQ